MTTSEILNLRAGRKIDRLVTEIVMGIHPRRVRAKLTNKMVTIHSTCKTLSDGIWTEHELGVYGACKRFSTEIAEAWLALPIAMNSGTDRGGMGDVKIVWNPYESRWEVTLNWSNNEPEKATAYTAPLAICRAALLAVASGRA